MYFWENKNIQIIFYTTKVTYENFLPSGIMYVQICTSISVLFVWFLLVVLNRMSQDLPRLPVVLATDPGFTIE